MEIKLRKIKKSDWPQINKLWKEYSNYHRKIFQQTDQSFVIFEPPLTIKGFNKFLNKKKKIFLAACDNDKIIGFIFARVRDIEFRNGKFVQGSLSEIFVTQKYRGKGVAELMWQEAMDWFKKEKVKFIQLHVLYNNKKPQEIYKKWGFKPLGLMMKRKI